jgi:hypothetical protein
MARTQFVIRDYFDELADIHSIRNMKIFQYVYREHNPGEQAVELKRCRLVRVLKITSCDIFVCHVI